MNIVKKLIAAGLFGSLAISLSAQGTLPDAFVDDDGNLVIGDQVIPPPAGEVVDGNLVIDGNTIEAPTATVNEDGSLELADGTVLNVPELPEGGDFIVSWFGPDLFDLEPDTPVTEDQFYFSFRYKTLYHAAASNWFFFYEMNSIFYIDPNSGARSLEGGVWAYTADLFPGQTEGIFVYLAGGPWGFNDLRDTDGDGILDIGDGEAGAQVLEGFMYVTDANGYDDKGPGIFYFSEFDTGDDPGNWIIRADGDGGPWVKLQEVVE
jgi:hypothetical protein